MTDKNEAKAGTSVLFKHEVWDHDAECPVHTIDAHQLRSGWVRVNILAKDGTITPPVDPNNNNNNNNNNGGTDGTTGTDGNGGTDSTTGTDGNGGTDGTTGTDGNGGNNGNNLNNNGGSPGTPGTPGTPGGPGIPQPRQLSPDATLRDLVLSHGTTVVPLKPGFMPETEMYAATVGVTVTQVTVTPTPTHPRAQVAYLDQNDRVLTDASDSESGFQVDVAAGDTVIKVKVTAEDGSTMQTYTVTVTRVVGLARNREGVGHEWLARFARTVGTQVVNVVGERFVAPRQPWPGGPGGRPGP